MNRTLLATKTFLPVPPVHSVPRPRLLAALDAGFESHCRLTLISAPAGWGKSSLLAEWANRSKTPAAWLSLDVEDNDLYRFWMYILFALQIPFPGACQSLLEDLRAAQPPAITDFLAAFINALIELSSAFILVIDDYHVIQNAAIHESLAYFIDHLPPTVRLVLSTRSDPAIPAHRWRARGQLIELRSADLRFNEEETKQFFGEVMRLNLRPDEILQLGERTEGWAVGLQLAGLSLQGREDPAGFIQRFSGSHHFVLEYLTNEVLLQQPPSVQEFLLQTSILDQLCSSLCQAVTGLEESAQLLDLVKDQNLFVIALDDERYWFRYHHLFAELLRLRLAKRGGDLVNTLHGRAARWYAENGLVDEALAHALAARDDDFAADLVNRNWRQAVHSGRLKSALKWLESLPEEKVNANALLCAGLAWTLWLIGRTSTVETYIERANHAYALLAVEGKVPADDYEYTSLPGQMAALQAMTSSRKGDWPGAIQFAQRAIELSPPQEALARGLAFSALGYAYRESGDFKGMLEAYHQSLPYSLASGNTMAAAAVIASIARIYFVQGKIQAAEETYRKALQDAEERGTAKIPVYGLMHIGLAELAYERNELDLAKQLLNQGMDQGRRGGYTDLLKNGAVLQSRLKRAEGDLPGGLAALDGVAGVLLKAESMLLYREVQAHQALFYAEMGEEGRALQWLEGLDLTLEGDPGLTRGIEVFKAACILAVLRRREEAGRLLARIETVSQSAGSRGRELEALVQHAVVLAEMGNRECALDCLRRALELGEAEGYARTYLDAGRSLMDLLKIIAARAGDARQRQAAALLKAAAEPAALSPASPSPLSSREVEVLRLLADGLSNAEIAEKLFVSFATIKTHVSHIYDKLDVQNRAEAVARAKERGIF